MVKFVKGGYAVSDNGKVYEVEDIYPNKYNPAVSIVDLVKGKRTYSRAIQTDKQGNEFVEYGTGYGRDRMLHSLIRPQIV